MTPEEKELLKKTHELAEENNSILKGIRSSNRRGTFFRVFYWTIIIGISVGAFYYIQPYVNFVFKSYNTLQSDLSGIKSVFNSLPKPTTK